MKKIIFGSLALLLMFSGCRKQSEMTKEILFKKHNKAIYIKDGWIRDPYIYLASDGFYYLTGTTPEANDPREINDPYNKGLDIPGDDGTFIPRLVG